jgi:hypothetical protein
MTTTTKIRTTNNHISGDARRLASQAASAFLEGWTYADVDSLSDDELLASADSEDGEGLRAFRVAEDLDIDAEDVVAAVRAFRAGLI